MASPVGICNRALQKLGAKRITSLDEDSVNGRACNSAYDSVRLAELRAHSWNCAITRAELAADATEPIFGRARSFTLPADWVRLLSPYPEDNLNSLDWVIEGKKIYTDESDPLYIRYIYDLEDAQEMDALLREAISCRLALELCEELTQSNTKKEGLRTDYMMTIREARRVNAIESVSAEPPMDEWLTCRN